MFSNDDRCPLDLWAPSGGHLTDIAFSGYAMMMSNIDDAVDSIVEEVKDKYATEDYEDSTIEISLPMDLTDWEIEYISQQVRKKLRNGW